MREHLHLFTGNQWMVFTAIALHANEDGWSWPGIRTLARETGLNPNTISDNLTELCKIKIDEKRILLVFQPRDGSDIIDVARGNNGARKKGAFATNHYLVFPTEEEILQYEGRLDERTQRSRTNSPCTVEPCTVEPCTDTTCTAALYKTRTSTKQEPCKQEPDETNCANAQFALDAQNEPQQPALEILDRSGSQTEEPHQPNSTAREKESAPRRTKKCADGDKAPSTRLMDAVREATTAKGITLNTGGQKVIKQVVDEVLPMESSPEEVKAAIALALSRNNVGVYPLRRLPQDIETYRNRGNQQQKKAPHQTHDDYMANTYDPHFAAYLEKVMAQQEQEVA
jgi:hypothetical protein